MKIVRRDRPMARARSGPVYTDSVVIQELVSDDDASHIYVTASTFVDRCRSTWHSHTTERLSSATNGVGIVADSHAEREVAPGDVVVLKQNESHWHGAMADQGTTHPAILMPGEMHVEPRVVDR